MAKDVDMLLFNFYEEHFLELGILNFSLRVIDVIVFSYFHILLTPIM